MWSRIIAYGKNLLAMEPAVLAWAVSGGLALLLAFVFRLSSTQEAAAATIITALASAVTAWKAGPSDVPVLTGLLATAVTAAGAFGFHPPAQVIAAVTSAVSVLLPLVLRLNLTPKASLAPVPRPAPKPSAPRVM